MSATRRRRRSTCPRITAQQALQILQSAVAYCQRAGLAVKAANSSEGLVLTVPGCRYRVGNGQAEFRLNAPVSPLSAQAEPTIGTPSAEPAGEGGTDEPLSLHS